MFDYYKTSNDVFSTHISDNSLQYINTNFFNHAAPCLGLFNILLLSLYSSNVIVRFFCSSKRGFIDSPSPFTATTDRNVRSISSRSASPIVANRSNYIYTHKNYVLAFTVSYQAVYYVCMPAQGW